MISTILLSAGLSSRFGSPKALACLDADCSQTIAGHILSTLSQVSKMHITVVLGFAAQDIEPTILKHKTVNVVYNKDYKLGQTSSFKAGLENVPASTKGVMLLPVDFPFIQIDTFRLLVEIFLKTDKRIVIPSFLSRKGHPPIFDMSLKKEFMQLNKGESINMVAQRHSEETEIVPVNDPAIIDSFNTLEEFNTLKSKYLE